ncbi:MAG: ROK family protein, partial [Gammaproteobacteria bacterium]|nr:ROK family protein [Gammaproteobacteria bacterium]
MRIGLDLGGTKIEGVILDREGIVVEKIRIDTPRDDYKKILESLCQVVNNLQSMATDSLTVGIGTPGALSTSTAIMKNSNSVCLNGHPLKADIEEQLGYAVRIENDANCFTLSEALHGAARHARTVFGVILGTGTGGGIVIEKNLLSGPNSIAGEWG